MKNILLHIHDDDAHVHRKGGILRLGHAKQRDDHGQEQAA